MHVAIIHYHLRPGGVTQVIANHLQSLRLFLRNKRECQVAILHGGMSNEFQNLSWADSGSVKVSAHVVPGLGYDQWPENPLNTDGLAKNILSELHKLRFSPSDSVIHVHNHSLGKNVSLPGALHYVASEGYPLLLQIHDFAEDFRAEQYQRLTTAWGQHHKKSYEILYPQAEHIHYAVLNSRDHKILTDCGVSVDRLHSVPNPIVDLGGFSGRDETRNRMHREWAISTERPLIIYPVRCIRRKNIGELLLWSALFRQRASFGTTLAPDNVAEKPSYDRWKALAVELQLPCYFELGNSFSFGENISAADALITTSVAEGFGMVFLESQLARRPLLGRKLPEITSDFESNGVDLSALYDRLAIPVDLLGKEHIGKSVLAAYSETIKKFELIGDPNRSAEESLMQSLATGTIDFSRLTPTLQEEIVVRVAKDKKVAEDILCQNPLLQKSIPLVYSQKMLEDNATAVQKNYAPPATGEKIENIYNRVLNSFHDESLHPLPHGERVLSSFLSVERFCPLRSMP